MSCVRPLRGFRTATGVVFSEHRREDHLGSIELPCGQCIECRLARASEWEMRVMHEASLHDRNCFVTLTYAPGNLPPNRSLRHADYQEFMKRLRWHAGAPVRFFMCGEYGELEARPHYHACLFGVDFQEDWVPAGKSKSGHVYYQSARLAELWRYGLVSVQPLVRETAGYCARYIMKKALGQNALSAYQSVDPETGEIVQRKPEYAAMSLKPGIGAAWFERYGRVAFPNDFIVVDGQKRPVPKYYKHLAERSGVDLEEVELRRELRRRASFADQTDERRRAREEVTTARVRSLTRNL